MLKETTHRPGRADLKEELKLLWKCKNNIGSWVMSGPAGDGGSRDGGWSIGRGLVGSNVGGRG